MLGDPVVNHLGHCCNSCPGDAKRCALSKDKLLNDAERYQYDKDGGFRTPEYEDIVVRVPTKECVAHPIHAFAEYKGDISLVCCENCKYRWWPLHRDPENFGFPCCSCVVEYGKPVNATDGPIYFVFMDCINCKHYVKPTHWCST